MSNQNDPSQKIHSHVFNSRNALQRNSLLPPKLHEIVVGLKHHQEQFSHDKTHKKDKMSKFRRLKKGGALKICIENSFQQPFKDNK